MMYMSVFRCASSKTIVSRSYETSVLVKGGDASALDRWTKKILRMKVHARQFQRAATNVAAMVFTSYLMTYMSFEPHSL